MKVNGISYFNLDNKNLKSNQVLNTQKNKELGVALISAPNYISFQGRPVANKITLVNENSKAIQAKIIKMFNIFPAGSRSQKASVFTVGTHNYGMKIDKMDNGAFKISVRNMIEADSEWTSPKLHQVVMNCVFDEKGIMTQGELMKNVNKNYTKRICYHVEGDSKRRLKFDGMTFRPSHGENKDLWNRMRDVSSHSTVDEMNFKASMADMDLSEIFFELTKNRASVLK